MTNPAAYQLPPVADAFPVVSRVLLNILPSPRFCFHIRQNVGGRVSSSGFWLRENAYNIAVIDLLFDFNAITQNWITTGPSNMAADKLVYNSHGQKYEVPRVRVSSLDEFRPGDHIAFHRRCGAYWHHAIVEWIDTERKEINVIEYSNTAKEFLNHNCSPPTITGMSIAKVVRGKYKLQNETVYLMKHERCLDPECVVLRAQSMLGDEKYHPLYNNCEHFAMWCKTGDSFSDQVNKAGEMLLKDFGVALSKELLTEEGRKGLIKLAEEIKETGVPKQVLEILEAGLTKGTESSATEQVIYSELFKMAKSFMTPTSQTAMARELMNVAQFWRFCSPADQMAVLQKTVFPGSYPGAFPLEKMTNGMTNTWLYLQVV